MKKFFFRSSLILNIHGGYTIISLEEKSHIRDAMGKKGIGYTVVSNGNEYV